MRSLGFFVAVCFVGLLASDASAEPLRAGTAKVDITDRQGKVNDPCYAKALVLQSGPTTVVLVTVDAVAIGEIGRIRSDFLAKVRREVAKDPALASAQLIINASHC